MTDSKKYNRDFIYHIPDSVLHHPALTYLDKHIYMLIRSFMDTTGDAYPSNGWIAKKCGIDNRSAVRSITRLIDEGLIIKKTVNNRRHLFIKQSGCTDLLVTLGSGGGDPRVMGGGDPRVTQLDQNNIISKRSGASEKVDATPVVVDEQKQHHAPHALDLFRDRNIPCPSQVNPYVCKVLKAAEKLLANEGFSLRGYLDYLTEQCTQWVFEPYNGRTNDFFVILRPDNIKKGISNKFEDRLCQ